MEEQQQTSKRVLAKSTKALICFMVAAVVLLVIFFIFYGVLSSLKQSYNNAVSAYAVASMNYSNAVKANSDVAIWSQSREEAAALRDNYNNQYAVCAFIAYVTSILAIICVGGGLMISDKFKTKEEAAANYGNNASSEEEAALADLHARCEGCEEPEVRAIVAAWLDELSKNDPKTYNKLVKNARVSLAIKHNT